MNVIFKYDVLCVVYTVISSASRTSLFTPAYSKGPHCAFGFDTAGLLSHAVHFHPSVVLKFNFLFRLLLGWRCSWSLTLFSFLLFLPLSFVLGCPSGVAGRRLDTIADVGPRSLSKCLDLVTVWRRGVILLVLPCISIVSFCMCMLIE